MEQTIFECAECGEPVYSTNGSFVKPCGHTEASVIANLEAIVTGTSSVS